eukprot:3499718-Rhodomonas_salina.1
MHLSLFEALLELELCRVRRVRGALLQGKVALHRVGRAHRVHREGLQPGEKGEKGERDGERERERERGEKEGAEGGGRGREGEAGGRKNVHTREIRAARLNA